MISFEKMGVGAAFASALIYIAGFVYFGAFWQYPEEAEAATQLAYLAKHQASFHIMNLFIYVVFGFFLAILVLTLYQQMKDKHAALVKTATVFGFIWVGLVIASGMIITIGLDGVLDVAEDNPDRALTIWLMLRLVTDGLGGGNEVVGGLWVLLISIAALRQGVFGKWINYLGILVGAAGILTLIPLELFTVIFGVSQIVWFFWMGISIWRIVCRDL